MISMISLWKWASIRNFYFTTKNMSHDYFFDLLLQQKLSFIPVCTYSWFGGFFLTHWSTWWNFRAFLTILKFEFRVYIRSTLWRLCLVHLFDNLKFNSFADLMNTGFPIIEISLFCGEEHRKLKYPRNLLPCRRHFKYQGRTYGGFQGFQNLLFLANIYF